MSWFLKITNIRSWGETVTAAVTQSRAGSQDGYLLIKVKPLNRWSTFCFPLIWACQSWSLSHHWEQKPQIATRSWMSPWFSVLVTKVVTWPPLNFTKLAHQKEVSLFLPKSHSADLERPSLESKAYLPGKTHFWFLRRLLSSDGRRDREFPTIKLTLLICAG